MTMRWIWILFASLLTVGCGEVIVSPFVEVPDAGIDINEDGGEDAGQDDHDGGPEDDDDAGIDDNDSNP